MGEKVKVVLDSNIWVSIFMKKTLGREFSSILKTTEMYVTEEIIKEISKVLIYPKISKLLDLAGVSEKEIIQNIIENSILIRPKFKLRAIKEDQQDNRILECASYARADFIVSGDKHLLKLKKFRNIKILTPREFLDTVRH